MNAKIVQLSAIPVVMIRHVGSFDDLPADFDRLYRWVTSTNLSVQRTIGMYYDNPDYTPQNQLRSAACFEVAGGHPATPPGPGMEYGFVDGGQYATMRYVGPYEAMAPVWGSFTNYIERNMGKQISESIPALEIYINDPESTPPAQLITDMYMPVY